MYSANAPRAVYPYTLRVRAQMPPAGQTVAATPAHHVPFATHDIAYGKVVHVGPDLNNLADELMANDQRDLDRLLCPLIPVVDVDISPANTGMPHPDQHIIDANPRDRHIFQPKAALRTAFYRAFIRSLSSVAILSSRPERSVQGDVYFQLVAAQSVSNQTQFYPKACVPTLAPPLKRIPEKGLRPRFTCNRCGINRPVGLCFWCKQ